MPFMPSMVKRFELRISDLRSDQPVGSQNRKVAWRASRGRAVQIQEPFAFRVQTSNSNDREIEVEFPLQPERG